jgi:hypothetical protein
MLETVLNVSLIVGLLAATLGRTLLAIVLDKIDV